MSLISIHSLKLFILDGQLSLSSSASPSFISSSHDDWWSRSVNVLLSTISFVSFCCLLISTSSSVDVDVVDDDVVGVSLLITPIPK